MEEDFTNTLNTLANAAGIDIGAQGEEKPLPQTEVIIDLSQPILELSNQLAQLLKHEGIYRHAGHYITINEKDPKNLTEEICPKVFVSWMQQFCKTHNGYYKENGEPTTPKWADMTENKSSLVLKSQHFYNQIPEIRSIIPSRLPVWEDGGKKLKLLKKGYNAHEKIYVLQSAPEIEEWPAHKAITYYHETFSSFPWGDESRSMSAHLACMVGMFTQLLFPEATTIPLFQFTANMEGSGKSLLARSALSPIYGIQCSSNDYSDNDKFTEILNSIAYSGQGFLFLDDLRGTIMNQALNRWITDPTWQFRRFHSQSMITVDKKCMTIITDNGSTLSDDLVRRAVIIHLETDRRAADRQKKLKNVITESWLAEHETRSQMLSMLWSMLRNWNKESRPKAATTIPSFHEWTQIVGGIVIANGFSEPFVKANLINAGDKRRTEFDLLLKNAIERFKPTKDNDIEIPLPELCAIARENGIFEVPLEDTEIIRIHMDNSPDRYYKSINIAGPGEPEMIGIPSDEKERNKQAARYMDPRKHAAPFSRRLKKMNGLVFEINDHSYRWRHITGRTAAYKIEYVN